MTAQEQMKLMKWDTTITDDDVKDAFWRTAGSPSDVGNWRSIRQIADALGVSKSPSLRRKLADMTERGLLEVSLYRLPNGVDAHLYRLGEVWG